MLTPTSHCHQTNLFGTDLLQQLDPGDPLLRLGEAIPWSELDRAFAKHYTHSQGRPSKPIRLMVGLLLLKRLRQDWEQADSLEVVCIRECAQPA